MLERVPASVSDSMSFGQVVNVLQASSSIDGIAPFGSHLELPI